MSIQFVAKGKGWVAGKSKMLKVPPVTISVWYEDSIMVKLPAEKRGEFDGALEKNFAVKEKDVLKMAEAKMRATFGSADEAIERDATKAAAWVSRAQSELAEVCRDIERGLISACVNSIGASYKALMNGVVLAAKVAPQAQAKMQAKIALTGDASAEVEAEADITEAAKKALTSLLYPLQDDVEGVGADAKAAAPLLAKCIKDGNILSKTMREQIKKPTPAAATLIKTTAAGMHKNLQTIGKLVEASQSKMRPVKNRLAALEGEAKDWKNADITGGIRLCASDAQTITELLVSFHAVHPIVEQLAKPFDGKTVPDFGKFMTVLNRLENPKPSHELMAHLEKLGDRLAQEAKD